MVGQDFEAQVEEILDEVQEIRRVEISPVHEASISPHRKSDEKIEDCLNRWFRQRYIGEPMIVRDIDTDEFLGLVPEGTKGPIIEITLPARSFIDIHGRNKSRPRRIFQAFARR
jgi:hypothetical protein